MNYTKKLILTIVSLFLIANSQVCFSQEDENKVLQDFDAIESEGRYVDNLKNIEGQSYNLSIGIKKIAGNSTVILVIFQCEDSSGADNFQVIGVNGAPSGLAKLTNNGEKIYANGSGQLIIESESPLQNITIYNVSGQIVYQEFNTSHAIINIKQGTYIIETITGESKSVQKVFVK